MADLVAEWMLANLAIARGQLFTASIHMATANRELAQLIGYLDGKQPEAQYIELGMKEIRSQLMKVVRALDMMPAPVTSPIAQKDKP